jgi:hypothetical protein
MKWNRLRLLVLCSGLCLIAGVLAFKPLTPSTVEASTQNALVKNAQTQLNHVAETTLSTAYVKRTNQLVVNGPDGHEIKKFTFILAPKEGEAYVSTQRNPALPEHLIEKIRTAKVGDRIIIDRVTSSKNENTLRLSPAMYEITP